MVNSEQLQAIAAMCNEYLPHDYNLLFENQTHISCEMCVHWQGICTLDKLDRILFGIEQR